MPRNPSQPTVQRATGSDGRRAPGGGITLHWHAWLAVFAVVALTAVIIFVLPRVSNSPTSTMTATSDSAVVVDGSMSVPTEAAAEPVGEVAEMETAPGRAPDPPADASGSDSTISNPDPRPDSIERPRIPFPRTAER